MAEPNQGEQQAQAAIARRLAEAGFALPGTLLERRPICGKPNCRCAKDPPQPHGPFFQWTRKVDGRTITRRLSAEQVARYGSWFANAKLHRELLSELEALSLRVAERGEDWTGKSR